MSGASDRVRAHLARTCRRLYEREMVGSTGGNVSVRVADRILISPTGRSLADLVPADFVEVTAGGEASGGRPSKELALHACVYAERPELGAVIHGHCATAIAAAGLLEPHDRDALPAYTWGYVVRVGRLPMIAYLPSGSLELARGVASALGGDGRAVLLRNHGFVTAGRTLEEAFNTAEEMVDALKVFLLSGGRAPALPAGSHPREAG